MNLEITPYVEGCYQSPMNLSEYKATLLSRFSNRQTRDSVERVAQDGSTKYAAQLVPIVRYNSQHNIPTIRLAFAVASWAIHLFGKTENGKVRAVYDGRRHELLDGMKVNGIETILNDKYLFGNYISELEEFGNHVRMLYKSIQSSGIHKTLQLIR
mmetsp:Transcript_13490/g.24191  ORF Transcript_13490/g.24191 Transcript_13490/m.24191 type:complete len:156 (+) Transcript_13490:1134-1601(+)